MVLYARVTPAAFAGTAPAKQAAAKATANTAESLFLNGNAFFIKIYLQTYFRRPAGILYLRGIRRAELNLMPAEQFKSTLTKHVGVNF